MLHALLQVVWTEMCVGSVCTQPPYNDNNPPSILTSILQATFSCVYQSISWLPPPPPPFINNTFSYTIKGPCVFSIWPILTFINNAKHRHLEFLLVIPMEKNHFLPSSCISDVIRITCLQTTYTACSEKSCFWQAKRGVFYTANKTILPKKCTDFSLRL